MWRRAGWQINSFLWTQTAKRRFVRSPVLENGDKKLPNLLQQSVRRHWNQTSIVSVNFLIGWWRHGAAACFRHISFASVDSDPLQTLVVRSGASKSIGKTKRQSVSTTGVFPKRPRPASGKELTHDVIKPRRGVWSGVRGKIHTSRLHVHCLYKERTNKYCFQCLNTSINEGGTNNKTVLYFQRQLPQLNRVIGPQRVENIKT